MRQLGVIEWRTVQVFLSETGIDEVELDIEDNRNIRCTCKKFKTFKKCKHTNWVDRQIVEAGGHFSVLVDSEVPMDEAEVAFDTPESFRKFVLKYGKVEVI